MKLSESLRRNILESFAGCLINKLKGKKRRTTYFFEDILANYVTACERAGYGKKMEHIGNAWCVLNTRELAPVSIREISPSMFFNLMKRVWISIGIMDGAKLVLNGKLARIYVKNNTVTRIIGENAFVCGCFTGIMEEVFGSEVKCAGKSWNGLWEEYVFEIGSKKVSGIRSKEKEKYNWLNRAQKYEGMTLKDAARKRIFVIKGNRVFFRGKNIFNSENTLFHLIGNENIMLEKVPGISFAYFKEIIEKDAAPDKKLLLMKNILQSMGWGSIKITENGGNILVQNDSPPYGLQAEKDNWIFLAQVILGYLWLIDSGLRIGSVKKTARGFRAAYVLSAKGGGALQKKRLTKPKLAAKGQ